MSPPCYGLTLQNLSRIYEFNRRSSINFGEVWGHIVLKLIFLLAVSFASGYGTREWISRRRRAAEREKFFRRKQEKLYNSMSELKDIPSA